MEEEAELLFNGQKPNPEKLVSFGFVQEGRLFTWHGPLTGTRLKMTVSVTQEGKVKADILDEKTQAPYVLHVTGGTGKFVGTVRACYQQTLRKIAEQCFEKDVFQTDQAKEMLAYALSSYNTEPEYLWKQLPSYAVLRRPDNAKWFAVIMKVPPAKIGLPEGGQIEIADLRVRPEELTALTDGVRYFPGYHMNKKHWLTLPLDGRLPITEILLRLDESYLLAKK